MTNHTIKLNRTAKSTDLHRYPGTYAAITDHIPDRLVDRLTAADLAAVINALYACAQTSKAIAIREALENGFVWDAKNNRSRDIAV